MSIKALELVRRQNRKLTVKNLHACPVINQNWVIKCKTTSSWRPCCFHIPTWHTWTHHSRKKRIQTQEVMSRMQAIKHISPKCLIHVRWLTQIVHYSGRAKHFTRTGVNRKCWFAFVSMFKTGNLKVSGGEITSDRVNHIGIIICQTTVICGE